MPVVTKWLLVFALIFMCQLAEAQEQTQAPAEKQDSAKTTKVEIDPAKRADITKMLELTGAGQMGMQAINQMITMQRQANPNVPPEFWDDFLAEVKPDELIELTIPSYDKHLTHDDIKQLIKFHESPIGKKLAKVQPMIVQESMVAGQKWGMELGRRIADRLQSEGYRP